MTSNIDPTLPRDHEPAVKADLRANLQAAKQEIEALQARQVPVGGGTGQVLKKLSGTDFHFDWGTDETGTGSGNFGDEVVLVDAQAGTDDSAKINNAIAAAKNAGKPLWFSKRQYNVNGKLSGISGWNDFIWYGNGAVLQVGDGVSGTSGGPFLHFTSCTRFAIFDLTVDGNNSIRGLAETFSGHNFQISSCDDFLFQNVSSNNACTDGWRVAATTPSDSASFSKRGRWLNCVADSSGRNGISFIEARAMQVQGGQYSNSFGANPAQGIDIEPNSGSANPGCEGITVQGALFFGNRGGAVQASHVAGVRNVAFIGNIMHNNGGTAPINGANQSHSAAAYLAASHTLFKDNLIYDHVTGNDQSFGVIFCPMSSATKQIIISGNILRNNTLNGTTATSWGLISSRGSGQARALIITDNIIELAATSNPGIRVECDFCLISANHINGSSAAPVGIKIEGSNNVCIGNIVHSGTGNQIVDSGTGNQVANNVVANA